VWTKRVFYHGKSFKLINRNIPTLMSFIHYRPNPTADKLFFFRTVPCQSQQDEKVNQSSSTIKMNDIGEGHNNRGRRKSSISSTSVPTTSVAEVLDITIDSNNELHFDDTHWENYMSNLKPLGLNVLLNTCNHETQEAYSAFHSHISHELIFNRSDAKNSHDLVVPVTSRRCLCELAKIIGFMDKATSKNNFILI